MTENSPHAELKNKSLWIWIAASVTFILDWATKLLALKYLAEQNLIIAVIPRCLNLRYAFNEGAAFSILQGQFLVLTTLSILALTLLIWWVYSMPGRSPLLWVAFGIIIGGAFGNLLDRIIRGGVIDFIDAYWGRYHWPTFNIADSAIFVGISVIIVTSLFFQSTTGIDQNQQPAKNPASAACETPDSPANQDASATNSGK